MKSLLHKQTTLYKPDNWKFEVNLDSSAMHGYYMTQR